MKGKANNHRRRRSLYRAISLVMAMIMLCSLPGTAIFAEEAMPLDEVSTEAAAVPAYAEDQLPSQETADLTAVVESDDLMTDQTDVEGEFNEEDFPEDEIVETTDLIEDDESWIEEEVFFDEEMLPEDTDEPAEEELTESEGTVSEDFFEELEEEVTEEADFLGASTSGTTGSYVWEVTGDTLYVKKGSGDLPPNPYTEPIAPSDILGYASIREIVINPSVFSLCDSMFENFTNIEKVTLRYSTSYIGAKTFKGCTSLKTVIFETMGKITIGKEAFSGCTALDTISLDASAKPEIGEGTFSGCKNLVSASFDFSKITRIGPKAFSGCTGLQIVDAGNAAQIGWRAFYGCEKLEIVKINSSLQEIEPEVFMNCTKLAAVVGWDNVTYMHYGAFMNCDAFTSVTLPSHLKTLGTRAFSGCTGLVTVSMGSEITTIEDGAFAGCTKLENLTLSESIASLGSVQRKFDTSTGYEGTVTMWEYIEKTGVFSKCNSLKKVTIPSKVTEIAPKLFYDSGVREVVLHDGITVIGSKAFEGSDLEKINWPAGIPVVPMHAFKYCTKLSEVTLNEGVTTIGDQAFDNCSSLKKLTFPSTLVKIGKDSFGGCIMLEAADLSKTRLTELPDRAFNGCAALAAVTLPDTILKTGVRAFSGTIIKSLTGPASLKTIGELTFDSCAELETLDLQYVQEFAANAVSNCPKLTKLDISNKITAVTDHSFVSNKVEKTVTFHGKKSEFETIPNLSKNTDLLSGQIIYTVPEETEVDLLEKVILTKTDQGDLPEASFAPLCAYASKTTKTSITIKWNKMDGAESYLVYGAARKKEAYKKLAQVSSATTKYAYKKLKKDTFYKFIVVAVTGTGSEAKIGAVSRTVIAATRGGKYRNATSVKSNTKKKIKLTAGKKQTLKPKIVSKVSVGRKMTTYRKTAYESSDPTVAKVTAKGKIKAVGKGTCTIYIYAQNGVYIAVKVKVS